ncbi:MAG: DUF3341 domain-containing protein [Myxococcaceae bacterium]
MATAASKASTWILGEFFDSEKLLEACRTLRKEGFTNLDTYSPYPITGAEEAMGLPPSKVPFMALGASLTGMATGYLMIVFFNAWLFPINVGNRLPHSPPANIPITFECAILFTAVGIFLGLLTIFFGFPRPHHPVFEVDAFKSATVNAYWVSVELPGLNATDAQKVKERLAALGGGNVSVVEELP